MVILEAAAIGAAGYGVYRGGDAAVRKGKETRKEMQRESVRRSQRNELGSKMKDRKDRIARIASLRGGGNNTAASNDNGGGNSSNNWPLGRGTSTATTASSSSSSLDQRHEDVMARLRESRAAEAKKSGKSRFGNIFKRKK